MQKKDCQSLYNYVNCVILIYRGSFGNKKKTAIVVEGGKMRKKIFSRRRREILLGIAFLVMALIIGNAKQKTNQALVSLEKANDPYLSYEAWIAVHEPEYQNSGDAQSAYYKYAEEHYSPEYREAQKKLALYRAGEIISLLIGVTLSIRQIYLFRQYCLKRQHNPFSSCAKHFAQEELQTNLKVCSFFCANYVETFSKIGKSSNVSLQEKNGSEYIIIINKKKRGNEFGI